MGSRFYLPQLFGDNVQTVVMEVLLQGLIEEGTSGRLKWFLSPEIAEKAQISRSAAYQVIVNLLEQDFAVEKTIETHRQHPPKYVRLNSEHLAIRELLFFYKKVRGLL